MDMCMLGSIFYNFFFLSLSLSTFSLMVYFDVDRIEQGTFILLFFFFVIVIVKKTATVHARWPVFKQYLFVLSCCPVHAQDRREREKKRGGEGEGGGLADTVGDCADDQLNTGRVNGSLVRVENRRGCARAVRQKKVGYKRRPAGGRSVGGLCACHY